jgi:hypothetical protein
MVRNYPRPRLHTPTGLDLLDREALADVLGGELAAEVLRRRDWSAVEAWRAAELVELILMERTRPSSDPSPEGRFHS